MDLVQFLWYAGSAPGINAIVGFVLSFVVEWFPEYDAVAPRWKRVIVMGLGFVVPLTSMVLLWGLGELALGYDTVYVALSAGFSAYFGSQVAHARKLLTVSPPEGMSFEEEGEMLFGD